MKKFVLYTIGFALLAFVPTILFTVLFNSGGGDVKDKLDRMEETLKAVSKTLQEVKTELEAVKGQQEVAEIKLDTVAVKLDMSRNTD